MSRAGDPDQLEVHIKRKSYRKAPSGDLQVLGEVSLTIASGQVAALIGPSGCGKTTLLRIIVGLDADYEGTVQLPAHGSCTALVFPPGTTTISAFGADS